MELQKEKLVESYRQSILCVDRYSEAPLDFLTTPIAEGKWSPYEIIGHLLMWDQFMLKQRIPQLRYNVTFPLMKDVQLFNEKNAEYVRTLSPLEVLVRFKRIRKMLILQMECLEDISGQMVLFGEEEMNLDCYWTTLLNHNVHHFEQVNQCLEQYKVAGVI